MQDLPAQLLLDRHPKRDAVRPGVRRPSHGVQPADARLGYRGGEPEPREPLSMRCRRELRGLLPA